MNFEGLQTAGQVVMADAVDAGQQPYSLMQILLGTDFSAKQIQEEHDAANSQQHDASVPIPGGFLQTLTTALEHEGIAHVSNDGPDVSAPVNEVALTNIPHIVENLAEVASAKPFAERQEIIAEVTQRMQNDQDLNTLLGGEDQWKQHSDMQLDLTVEEFWAEFLDENAKFGLDKLQEIQGFWNVKIEPWNDARRSLNLQVPVVGTPLISETRVEKTISKVHKSENKLIIDIESKALDIPYSDYFVSKAMWVIVGSEKDPNYPYVQLKQFYQVKFNKYTFFQSQIVSKSEEGLSGELTKWKNFAQEHGHFEKKKLPGHFIRKIPAVSDQNGFLPADPMDQEFKPDQEFVDPHHREQNENFDQGFFQFNNILNGQMPAQMMDLQVPPIDSMISMAQSYMSFYMIIPVVFVIAFGVIMLTIEFIPDFIRLERVIDFLLRPSFDLTPQTTYMDQGMGLLQDFDKSAYFGQSNHF